MSEQRLFHYDLCIVGAGMIGSAAARYVSTSSKMKVCLIGPEESKERASTHGDEIFGTHYDNSRIASRTEHVDSFWADLARASIDNFRNLEEQSGIKFYNPVGYMSIGCQKYLDSHTNKDFVRLGREDLREKLGYMNFSDDDCALFDEQGGWINPRKLVDAEILVSSKHGCDVLRNVVCEITETYQDSVTRYTLRTERGTRLISRRVLLATNVFTMHRNLLPSNVVPKFYASPQTVVLGEVDNADLEILRSFPSICYHGRGGDSWYEKYPRNRDGNIHFYSSSVNKHPDGKYYIKFGHSDDILDRYIEIKEVSRWYCGDGDPSLVHNLTELLKSVFTGLKFKSFKSDACVTMVTATGKPYIDKVNDNFGVAIGGNGHAAMSCDAIGRLAARMMLNSLDEKDKRVLERCKLVTEKRTPSCKL